MTYPQQPQDPSAPPPPLQYGQGQAPPPGAVPPGQMPSGQMPPGQTQAGQMQPGFAPQYGQPAYTPPRTPQQKAQTMVAIWGALALVAVVCGISIPEDDHMAWDSVHAWGALAILGAVMTLVPTVAGSLSLSAERGWQIAVGGAAILVFYWVLLVLPSVGSNMSLVTTVGVVFGCIAAALAPGRPPARTP